jgi:hypothetical protein
MAFWIFGASEIARLRELRMESVGNHEVESQSPQSSPFAIPQNIDQRRAILREQVLVKFSHVLSAVAHPAPNSLRRNLS